MWGNYRQSGAFRTRQCIAAFIGGSSVHVHVICDYVGTLISKSWAEWAPCHLKVQKEVFYLCQILAHGRLSNQAHSYQCSQSRSETPCWQYRYGISHPSGSLLGHGKNHKHGYWICRVTGDTWRLCRQGNRFLKEREKPLFLIYFLPWEMCWTSTS